MFYAFKIAIGFIDTANLRIDKIIEGELFNLINFCYE